MIWVIIGVLALVAILPRVTMEHVGWRKPSFDKESPVARWVMLERPQAPECRSDFGEEMMRNIRPGLKPTANPRHW